MKVDIAFLCYFFTKNPGFLVHVAIIKCLTLLNCWYICSNNSKTFIDEIWYSKRMYIFTICINSISELLDVNMYMRPFHSFAYISGIKLNIWIFWPNYYHQIWISYSTRTKMLSIKCDAGKFNKVLFNALKHTFRYSSYTVRL